jgi:cell division protein FtsQ
MNIKSPLIKFFTVLLWCVLGGSGLVLLIAAINAKNSSLCSGLEVEINDGGKAFFLNKKEVTLMLENEGVKDLRNRKTISFDLMKMENILRKNNWIKEAHLYFDNNQTLKVSIQERQPVARLFTVSGNSYLIDSNGVQMAVGQRTVFRLPVFTGYPEDKFGLRKDSALNRQIKDLAIFLNNDSFWSAQIQELYISTAKTFIMTPLLGSQIIEFGDGSNYKDKFRRLLIFYKEVIAQTGFEKYTGLNLAFTGQIICTRKQDVISRADSVKARKNVMEMIRIAQKMESDTAKIREVKPLERATLTEQNLRSYDLPQENGNQDENKHQKQQ